MRLICIFLLNFAFDWRSLRPCFDLRGCTALGFRYPPGWWPWGGRLFEAKLLVTGGSSASAVGHHGSPAGRLLQGSRSQGLRRKKKVLRVPPPRPSPRGGGRNSGNCRGLLEPLCPRPMAVLYGRSGQSLWPHSMATLAKLNGHPGRALCPQLRNLRP